MILLTRSKQSLMPIPTPIRNKTGKITDKGMIVLPMFSVAVSLNTTVKFLCFTSPTLFSHWHVYVPISSRAPLSGTMEKLRVKSIWSESNDCPSWKYRVIIVCVLTCYKNLPWAIGCDRWLAAVCKLDSELHLFLLWPNCPRDRWWLLQVDVFKFQSVTRKTLANNRTRLVPKIRNEIDLS